MEPFVALMRRYVVDYTNRHDTSVCGDIMDPGYTLRMGAHVLQGRDNRYIPAAAVQFKQFPGLTLTVHEIVTNGQQLAMRFSEHGASDRHYGAVAAWTGIGLYRWDGKRLLENFVEQDYLSRRRQLAARTACGVEAPATAPWDTAAQPPDARAESLVRTWIEAGMPGEIVRHNDGSSPPVLARTRSTVDLIFSAGDAVAFRVTQRGEYTGGLDELDASVIGQEATLHLVGVVHTRDGEIIQGRIVSNRLDLVHALTPRTAPLAHLGREG